MENFPEFKKKAKIIEADAGDHFSNYTTLCISLAWKMKLMNRKVKIDFMFLQMN